MNPDPPVRLTPFPGCGKWFSTLWEGRPDGRRSMVQKENHVAEPEDPQDPGQEHPQPMVERSRFGVTERGKDPVAEEYRLRSPVVN